MSVTAPSKRPSFSFAKRQGVLVAEIDQGKARVISRVGATPAALAEVRRFLGLPLQVESVSRERYETLLQQAYEGGAEQDLLNSGDFGEEFDLDSIAQQLSEPEDLLESQDDAPIIRLINGLLTQAVKENASDIHIEPFENRLRVRIRVDGILKEVMQPSRLVAPLVISRLKVMARLDIAEKRLPQDGRISLKIAGRPVDVRVSTIPSGYGERVVLRLLDKQAGRLDLEQLGMAPEAMAQMDRMIHRPNGIILVTGPTGSGKTTTLYAALTRLNESSRNIMTVEDPIEYYLDGIGQTQVNPKVQMTFARGLRAILRQDPDVVMVGEIRDLETAEIAVQASLTGHLVVSTLHTNTAVGAVTRLRDMGIEPFLLSSTLVGVLAQRLVRVLCSHCKEPYTVTPAELADLGVEADINNLPTIYRPRGCDHCHHQGFTGRTGIYDLVATDAHLQEMVHNQAGQYEIEKYVRSRSPDMRQDGWRRILAGDTTVTEVLRVTRED
ncbi:type II secretion system ATPase GspE [Desulfurivibrio dismutans]|uniref:type II secretion system ATPase GspE n=1 Tax=Desulfurivibrio dismutans TaxID=1398908 RepID=UPI0023DC0937|nr:type II secretion system ATPase GspE [Desulfurivibrio alkaliphilus]MDF1613752.1 type II secretion system ATPase GspE [Desulfurivibrio alkaliphilus]